MEAIPDATAFVNFANAIFGYGEFIASCTQEEILQVCCPEFNVGMLFQGTMRDEEVMVVHGCRRYSAYSGYLHSSGGWGLWVIIVLGRVRDNHGVGVHLHFDTRRLEGSPHPCQG